MERKNFNKTFAFQDEKKIAKSESFASSNEKVNKDSEPAKFFNKTKIEKRLQMKRDFSLVDTIIKLKKTNPEFAKELARPKRRWPAINLKDIEMIKGDVLIPGKVLSAGDLETAKKIVAWSISKKALEKIKNAKGTFVTIKEEIKNNPELNGFNIVR